MCNTKIVQYIRCKHTFVEKLVQTTNSYLRELSIEYQPIDIIDFLNTSVTSTWIKYFATFIFSINKIRFNRDQYNLKHKFFCK